MKGARTLLGCGILGITRSRGAGVKMAASRGGRAEPWTAALAPALARRPSPAPRRARAARFQSRAHAWVR